VGDVGRWDGNSTSSRDPGGRRQLQGDRERQKRRRLEGGERPRRRLPYGNLFPSSSQALLVEGQSVPVISFSSGKGEAGKRIGSTSSGLAKRTSWRVRNTRFNLKLKADILLPFSLLGRKPHAPSGAPLGRVLDEVGA
jgi:hypothetical protein